MESESTAAEESLKLQSDRLRWSFEDPMHNYLKLQRIRDKEERVRELQMMLESSTSSDSDSSCCRKRKRKKRLFKTEKVTKKKRIDLSDTAKTHKHRKKKRHYSHESDTAGCDNSKYGHRMDTDSFDTSHRKRRKHSRTPSKRAQDGNDSSEDSEDFCINSYRKRKKSKYVTVDSDSSMHKHRKKYKTRNGDASDTRLLHKKGRYKTSHKKKRKNKYRSSINEDGNSSSDNYSKKHRHRENTT